MRLPWRKAGVSNLQYWPAIIRLLTLIPNKVTAWLVSTWSPNNSTFVASNISVILLLGSLKGRPLLLFLFRKGTPPEKSGPVDAAVAPIAIHLADEEPNADLHLSLSLFNPWRGRNEG